MTEWKPIVWTRHGSRQRLYVNGRRVRRYRLAWWRLRGQRGSYPRAVLADKPNVYLRFGR